MRRADPSPQACLLCRGKGWPGELPRDPCDDVTTLDDVPIVEWEGVLYLAA